MADVAMGYGNGNAKDPTSFSGYIRACMYIHVPSGKDTKNYGKSPCWTGQLTQMTIFNSYLKLPKDSHVGEYQQAILDCLLLKMFCFCRKHICRHIDQYQRFGGGLGCRNEWLFSVCTIRFELNFKRVWILFDNRLLVGGLACFIFPHIGNNHPNWRTHIFQRSWNHQPDWHFVFRTAAPRPKTCACCEVRRWKRGGSIIGVVRQEKHVHDTGPARKQ